MLKHKGYYDPYKLALRFPFINMDWPCNIESPVGWTRLVFNCSREIHRLIKKNREMYRGFEVVQIKEKFGGLRYYTTFTDDKVSSIINKYERISLHTCMDCGSKHAQSYNGGWVVTLCKRCLKNYLERKGAIK